MFKTLRFTYSYLNKSAFGVCFTPSSAAYRLCGILLPLMTIVGIHQFDKVRAHSPTFLSLHLRHNSFSNPSVALPTSQLILQPFHCFTYIAVYSPTLLSLLLRHSSFSNPSLASPTSQVLHLIHLASCPWILI